MLIDCHAHPDGDVMNTFLKSYEAHKNSFLEVALNGVNLQSSRSVLELGRKFQSLIPFVGIHPERFLGTSLENLGTDPVSLIHNECKELSLLIQHAAGIGEIGLDPKYGHMDLQRLLFQNQLEIAERSSRRLPLTIHSRETLEDILGVLSEFNLAAHSIQFHWFSGSEEQLSRVNQRGYFVSFGLPALYSKRVGKLISSTDPNLLLAETDSPVRMDSIFQNSQSPYMIASVLFSFSRILGIGFEEAVRRNFENAMNFLKRKTH